MNEPGSNPQHNVLKGKHTTTLYTTRTCATRPFQISAFFDIPHGALPSLKFQRLSDKAVVVVEVIVAVGVGVIQADRPRGDDTLGTKAVAVGTDRTARRRNKICFIML